MHGRIQPANSTAQGAITATQRRMLEGAGENTSPETWERAKWAAYQELAQEIPAADRDVYAYTGELLTKIGPYQNPRHLFLLTKHTAHLLETANKMGPDWVVENDLVVASTLSGHFNAKTVALPRDRGNLLLFNDGTITLCWLMGRVVGRMYSSVQKHAEALGDAELSPAHFRSALPKDIDNVQTASHLIWGYVLSGGPRAAMRALPPGALDPAPGIPTTLFAEGMLRHVIAHELGHLRERHLAPGARDAFRLTYPEREGFEYSFDWVQEGEADRYGATVAAQSVFREGVQPLMAGLVVQSALVIQGLVEWAVALLTGPATGFYSDERRYPPSDGRLQFAQDGLDYLERNNPSIAGLGHAHEVAWTFLKTLRIYVQHFGTPLIEKGLPPHPDVAEGVIRPQGA